MYTYMYILFLQANIYSKEGVLLAPVVSTDSWIWCARANHSKDPLQVVGPLMHTMYDYTQ